MQSPSNSCETMAYAKTINKVIEKKKSAFDPLTVFAVVYCLRHCFRDLGARAYLGGGHCARIAKLHRKVCKIEACPPFASWA